MSSTIEILKQFDLRKTNSRAEILQLFIDHDQALAESDLEKSLNGHCDRATIYRTLKTFLDKGLIHKVIGEESVVKYALCDNQSCSEHEHHHDHLHFKCLRCGKTTCINDVFIPHVELPAGYKVKEMNMLVSGICKTCND